MEEKLIEKHIGNKIRMYRKIKKYTLDEFSKKIYKSKGTLSKYENGEITIDIVTLNDIAKKLDIPLKYFIDFSENEKNMEKKSNIKKEKIKYFYFYDMRKKGGRIVEGVIEKDTDSKEYIIYWNIENNKEYKKCGYVFHGRKMESGTSIRFVCTNDVNSMDLLVINYFDNLEVHSKELMGNITSFSIGEFENYSTKCIISDTPLKKDDEIKEKLKISKEAISDLRKTNTYRMKKI